MEWVKTSERWPEPNERVIAATPDGVGYFEFDRWGAGIFTAEFGFVFSTGGKLIHKSYKAEQVLVWAPVPQVPEWVVEGYSGANQ